MYMYMYMYMYIRRYMHHVPYMYSRVPDSHYTALRFTMVNTRAAFLEVWFSEREAALQ